MNTLRCVRLELILLICLCLSCSKLTTPESNFKALFADLSTGVPAYQTFKSFTHPDDALKGDVCTAEFIQTDAQFAAFATSLGTSPSNILSSAGVWVTANSKMDPKYPWQLLVHADMATNALNPVYRVHIEGMQPYN